MKHTEIYTTVNLTRWSVSDGSRRLIWAPYLRLAGRGLGVVDTRYGVECAWLAGRGRCTESRPELEISNNGLVRLDRGRSSCFNAPT